MFSRAIVAIAVLFALAAATGARELIAEPLLTTGAQDLSIEPLDSGDRTGARSCRWAVRGWLTGDETYCVLSDPDRGSGPHSNWEPDGVTIYLYWDEDSVSPITLKADLRRLDASDPGRPVPGSTIVTSEPVTVGPFPTPGLKAISIPLPRHAEVTAEPLFASVHFIGSCGSPPALVTDDGGPRRCTSLTRCDGGWSDLSDHGFPGTLSIHVTTQRRVPTPPLLSTWTSIKSSYRGGRVGKLGDCGARDPVEG